MQILLLIKCKNFKTAKLESNPSEINLKLPHFRLEKIPMWSLENTYNRDTKLLSQYSFRNYIPLIHSGCTILKIMSHQPLKYPIRKLKDKCVSYQQLLFYFRRARYRDILWIIYGDFHISASLMFFIKCSECQMLALDLKDR